MKRRGIIAAIAAVAATAIKPQSKITGGSVSVTPMKPTFLHWSLPDEPNAVALRVTLGDEMVELTNREVMDALKGKA